MIGYILALIASTLGIGFFVYLRRSGKKEGIKEVKLETAEKVIQKASKANSISKRVDGLGAIDLDRLRRELNNRD